MALTEEQRSKTQEEFGGFWRFVLSGSTCPLTVAILYLNKKVNEFEQTGYYTEVFRKKIDEYSAMYFEYIARDIVNIPKLQYGNNNFTVGSFLRNFAYKYDSDRHWAIKTFETPFRLVHNMILLGPALFTILEKAALLFMVNGPRLRDHGPLGKLLISVGTLVASLVFMCARIISCTLWAVLDPINNIKSIWNNSTLSTPTKVVFIIASAVVSCAAYAYAPILLLKFAPLFMAKILAPLKALASWTPISKIATAVSAAPKAVALTAVCVASGLLNTISAVCNHIFWGAPKKPNSTSNDNQSDSRTGSMSSAGTDDDNDSRLRISSNSSYSWFDRESLISDSDRESLISDSDPVADGEPKEQQPGGLSSSS